MSYLVVLVQELQKNPTHLLSDFFWFARDKCDRNRCDKRHLVASVTDLPRYLLLKDLLSDRRQRVETTLWRTAGFGKRTFNGSLPAMKPEMCQSRPDSNPSVEFLQSGPTLAVNYLR